MHEYCLSAKKKEKNPVEHKSDGDTNCSWCTIEAIPKKSKKKKKTRGELGIRKRIETIQGRALLISARILRRILETGRTC